jgi:hypothetical protein
MCNDSFEWKNPLKLRASVSDIDSSPPKEPRIHRPCARSKQRQGSPDGCQEDAGPRIANLFERLPNRKDSDERSDNGSPEPGDQSNPRGHQKDLYDQRFGVRRRLPHDALGDQGDASH